MDNASRVDEAPTSALYDTNGSLVTKLETTDVRVLKEAGYTFDPAKKYPIILTSSADGCSVSRTRARTSSN